MSKFQMRTEDQGLIDVIASDPSTVLQIANRRNVSAGDVYCDGHYLFSFQSGAGGCWLIEGRSGEPIVAKPHVEA